MHMVVHNDKCLVEQQGLYGLLYGHMAQAGCDLPICRQTLANLQLHGMQGWFIRHQPSVGHSSQP